MVYLKYRDKVERIADCQHCKGRGWFEMNHGVQLYRMHDGTVGKFLTGSNLRCSGCSGTGKVVTYPWTRGKSLPPLIRRT
jgi:hypothetical protein